MIRCIAPALFILIGLSAVTTANAQDAVSSLISSLEPEIKREFEDFKAKLIDEAQKRGTDKDEKSMSLAIDGVKSLVYNRAYGIFKCITEASSPAPVNDCIRRSTIAIAKVNGFIDYISVIKGRDQIRCELESRLFEAELVFPAFEFLRQVNGPNALYDFEHIYSCLMSAIR